jgi:hypothetical protein
MTIAKWWLKKFLMKDCIKMKSKEKLLALKLNSLLMHGGRRKALISVLRVCKIDGYYMNKDFVYAKNEYLYVALKKNTIVISSKFVMLLLERRKKNWFNFLFVNFHKLIEGGRMIDYKNMRKFLYNFP